MLSNASYFRGNSPSSTPMVWAPFSSLLASMCPMVQGSPFREKEKILLMNVWYVLVLI